MIYERLAKILKQLHFLLAETGKLHTDLGIMGRDKNMRLVWRFTTQKDNDPNLGECLKNNKLNVLKDPVKAQTLTQWTNCLKT